MKKAITLFFTLLVVLIVAESVQAQLQNLTYEVRAQNFTFTDDITNTDPNVSSLCNEIQFDLYIQQTNSPSSDAEKMRYALGQYYWNANFWTGLTVADTTGGYATYSYIPGSTSFTNLAALPTNPNFLGMSTNDDILDAQGYPVGSNRSQIRTNSNVALGNMSDVQISTVYPGTKIGRYKLRRKEGFYFTPDGTANTTGSWFHMRFRVGPLGVNSTNPFTKVFAYNGLGGLNTDVTNKGTFIMDTIAGALPVELSSFTATSNRNSVNLNWSTVSELNNSGFDIERKTAGTNDWTRVGFVSGNGTVSETRNYVYTDRTNVGRYNYRLKQIDFNGNYEYFNLSSEIEVGVPSSYAMSQNYPNPFNPSTKINYDLPKDGQVSIILYDLTGRQVATLVNEVKTAGYYTVQFNATNLSSGMYFYRITASDFVSTKKMVLVK